jgi:PAS domain S-box-containing protein
MNIPRTAFVALLLFAGTGQAQEIGEPFQDTWRWVHFTQASGLPSNQVQNIIETADGTPWALTQEGLAWYDGWHWHTIREEGGLPAGLVDYIDVIEGDQILAISGGKLFVGGAGGFRHLPLRWQGKEIYVTQIDALEGGDFLLEEHRGGFSQVWLHHEGTLEPIKHPISGETRFDMASVLTMQSAAPFLIQGNLYRYEEGKWTLILDGLNTKVGFRHVRGNSKQFGLVNIYYPADMQGLWEWTDRSEPRLLSPREISLRPRVFDISQGGNALVVYESGEVSIRRDGRWQDVDPYVPAMASCKFVRFHSNGEDIWVGSDRGLFLYRRSSNLWSVWRHAGYSPLNVIHQILPRSDGSVWLATLGGLEIRYPDGSMELIDEIAGDRIENITALAEDGEGRVWIGSGAYFHGAYCWDGESWRHFGRNEGLAAATIHKIQIDRKGRPWFLGLTPYATPDDPATGGPGAFVLDGESFQRWGEPEGLASGRVYDFREGDDGSYWFGTWRGLSRWQGEEWTHWGGEDRFDRVFALATDTDGRAWFSGQHRGFGYLEDDRPVFPAPLSGFSTGEARELTFDSEGRLWAGTASGVAVMCDGEWSWLHQAQGFISPEIWPVQPMEDRVLIGTLGNGTSILDLQTLGAATPKATLNCQGALGHGSAEFTWEANSFWGTLPSDQIMTRHRLDQGPWSPWSLTREVQVQDLNGGQHTLEVQAQDPLRSDPLPSDIVSFDLTPILTRNPLFFLPIAFLTLSLIGLGGFHLRRKRQQGIELKRSEEHYHRLFDTSRDGILLLTTDGDITDANPAARELLGRDRSTLIGLKLADLCASSPNWGDAAWLASKASLGSTPDRLDLLRDDDRIARTEVSVGLLDLSGRPMIQMILRNVSWRLRLELNLQRARRLEALGTLAGGVAHDFNNILTAIGGFSELLGLGLGPEDPNRSTVEEITRGVDRASALTKQLLAFSRRQIFEPCALDANEVIRELEGMLGRLVSEEIDLICRLDPELPPIVADRAQFEQVIVNLVMNAQDAMPGGGDLIIETQWASAENSCKILVSDTGAGMDQEILDHLFEPFFSTKQEGKGTGLGLSTVYGIVSQSMGRIDVSSTPGVGTVVTVVFQAAGSEATAESKPSEERVGGVEEILIVEDEEIVREATSRMLGVLGYRVLTAPDGETALRLAGDPSRRIDLVITDVVMPGMSGPEAMLELHKLRSGIPVIYMSGYISENATRNAMLTPEDVILHKPFNLTTLAHEVRRVLDSHAVASEIEHRTPTDPAV